MPIRLQVSISFLDNQRCRNVTLSLWQEHFTPETVKSSRIGSDGHTAERMLNHRYRRAD